MRVITETPELEAACAAFADHPFVTVDTEFLREQTFWPELCLIQMAVPGEEVIVDPLSRNMDLAPFFELMNNTTTVKVFHAGRQDIEIIYAKTRTIPAPMFDTQVAAMVCGFGESVGYVNLAKKILNVDLDKGARFTDWSKRPLSQKQLEYALADVTHLRDIYLHLVDELATTNRSHWLGEEMAVLEAPETYVTEPQDAWKRLKMRVKNKRALGVLMELAEWRETLAQSQDIPRNRILRDEALYDIANQAPASVDKLGELRTLSQGFARSARAKEIIAAVKRGQQRDPKELPALNSGPGLSAESAAILDLLKVLLKANAARHRVAPKMIADSGDLERIATEEKPDIQTLKGWRYEMFGADALKLRNGQTALTVIDGNVMAVPAGPKPD